MCQHGGSQTGMAAMAAMVAMAVIILTVEVES